MNDGRGRIAEPAVAEPEVQGRAHDDDEVRARERRPTRARHQERMLWRQDTARHAVGDDGHARDIDKGAGRCLRAVGPHIAAEHEHRTLGPAKQPRDPIEVLLIRSRDLRAERIGRGVGRRREEDVHGDIDEDRAAMRAARDAEGVIDRRAHARRVMDR